MESIFVKKWLFKPLCFIVVVSFFLIYKNTVYAAPSLQQNESGAYCINNADDYLTFINDVHNNEGYKDCKIIITDDIVVEGPALTGTFMFYGNIDGQGHSIDFTANNLVFERNVFPFSFRDGAGISNLKLCVHEVLRTNKVSNPRLLNLQHSVINCGQNSYVSNVEISGEVVLVYDKAKTNVTISAISGGDNSSINNCSVNLNFDYDKTNSLSDDNMKSALSQKSIEFRIINNQSYGGEFAVNNFYSGSDYSQNVKDLMDFIGSTLDTTGAKGGVIKFMWGNPSYSKVENTYFDIQEYPEIIENATDNYKVTIANNTLPNNDSFGKSTADMKLQATYTDFDFDNIWGMSDTYNDGYPFIVAEDVKDAKKLIAALPAQITTADKAAVEAALAAYNALSDDQKLQVPAALVQTLKDAEKAIEEKPAEKTKPKKQEIKKGTKFIIAGNKYQVTGDKTASFIGGKNKKAKKITVPASVTYKKQTFKVTAIGPKACKGYKKLKVFVVGKNVITIGAQAFANTPKLKKLQVKSMALKKVGAKACKGMHKKGVIKVPKKMLKKYKKLFKGKGQKKTVKIK